MKQDCIYKDMCDKDVCPQSCIRYEEMKYMLEHSNIPKARQRVNVLVPEDCDLRAFEQLADIRNKIFDFVNHGENLYLWSTTCGNGKTTWAIKLLLQYFNEMWPCNNFTKRGLFINTNTFLFDVKASFDKYDEEVENIKRIIPDVDLVVFDDICSGKLSQYDVDLILNFVDRRINNGKSIIFTGNIRPNELKNYVGDRLASRILGSTQIQLRGTDKR